MEINEELLSVLKRCCDEKGVSANLRIEDRDYTVTLESKEANNHVERLFYDAILHYGIGSECISVQFMNRGNGTIALSFEAFGLDKDKKASLKIRIHRPSSDILEVLLEFARHMGYWDIVVDKDKVLRGETSSSMVCFSVDENKNLTISTAEKGVIQNFVLERVEDETYLSIPYTWDVFEKLLKEHSCLPFCDVLSLDVTNLSFKKGVLATTKKPLVVKQDANKGGLREVLVVGGRV